MSDFDYHPTVMAADSTDLQASTLSRIAGAFTKGAPTAAASGILSIANTILDYAGKDQIDVGAAISKYDLELGDYYQDNKQAIDMVGFVGTALLPASLAVKGVQIARSGNALGNFGRALNIFSSPKNKYLKQALQETAQEAGAVKGILSANRMKHLGFEVADQALLGLAAETAIVGLMNDNPVFDTDTAGDFAWNMTIGTALSGGIGGVLGSLAARGILKTAATEIQQQSRLVDTVFDPARLGLGKGTETMILAESIAKLPDEFLNMPFNYKVDGIKQSIELETAGAFKSAKQRAEILGAQKLGLKFNELATGDANIGQAYYQLIKEGLNAARTAGKTVDEQMSLISGYLANVNKISSIDMARAELDARKFYVRQTPMKGSPLEIVTGMASPKMTRETGKQAYILADNVTEANLVMEQFENLQAQNISQAFKQRPDLDVIRMPDGTLKINQSSRKIIKLNENPYVIRQFVDLETGTITPEAAYLFGDIIGTASKQLKHGLDYVSGGGQLIKMPSHYSFNLTTSPLEASARFAWASKLTPNEVKAILRGEVNTDDLAMLDRLKELVEKGQIEPEYVASMGFMSGGVRSSLDELGSLQQVALESRYMMLRGALDDWTDAAGGVPNTKVIAAHLNTDREWVEEAISSGFEVPQDFMTTAGRIKTTDEALKPQTVQVQWDFTAGKQTVTPTEAYEMNMGPSHLVTQKLTKEYQLQIRQRENIKAMNSALGNDAELFMDSSPDLARKSTSQGAGASGAGASNANYGDNAGLFVQDTGKNVALVTQKRRDAVIETLSPAVNAIRDNPAASTELGILTNTLRKNPNRLVFDPDNANRIVSTEVMARAAKTGDDIDTTLSQMAEEGVNTIEHTYIIRNNSVADFLRTTTTINAKRQSKFTTLYNAMGMHRNVSAMEVIYVPPIDTVKYPFHAIVRSKEKAGLATDHGMITARSEDQLRELAKRVSDDFDVIFKNDTANYFKAKGEYDYSLGINESRVNSELARRGVLADVFPETRFENVMSDWLQWHARQEEKLVREAVQVGHRQFFSEMNFLSENYRVVSESVARGIGSKFKAKVQDPFGDYAKTALNISKQQEFPLLDGLNEFVDKIGVKLGEGLETIRSQAVNGTTSMKQAAELANDLSAHYGMGVPYNLSVQQGLEAFALANQRVPKNLLREGFQKANAFLATATLRLDFANSLVNIISTPIMLGTELASIKRLIAEDSTLAGKLTELTSLPVPGRNGARAPSTTKLLGNAVNNYFGPEKASLFARYKQIGSIKDVSQLYHEILDDLSFNATVNPNKWMDKVNSAVERGAKISGNTFSEDFTRFISADVMRQLSQPVVDAGKMSVKEQNAYISTFVNRVQGNYVTSQRPIMFQGTTGAAISLFQTYAFNVLQQLFRHVEAGDKKTLLTFAGLQSSVFGLNGLPFFDAVNTHLIGGMIANNPTHNDAYNVLPAFNKELGDWMLYGSASAMPLFTGSAPALFTRGDINPRHLTILPTNPIDVPAVQASIRMFDTVTEFGKNIMPGSGVDFSQALLKGMEHQGLNRPLAGMAQVLSGRATNSKGALISAASEMETASWLGSLSERMIDFGGVSRLAGARPMDEAVALNALYRQKGYDAMDKARIERLGEQVKTKLYNNKVVDDEELEDFMLRYTRSGGRIESFSQSMQRWMKDANSSVVNQMANKLGSSYSKNLQMIMGGDPLQDYRNAATTSNQQLGEQ